MNNLKRRQQLRHPLRHPIPVLVRHRSLRRSDVHVVEGLLLDASEQGMGVLVMEPVELASRCTIEVCDEDKPSRFRGEICYATKTEYGIRLGIELDDDGSARFLGYLGEISAELE
ncbi:MAG: PilZ domain-containing protein [Pseudomonadota bacterium]|uniref:PilZ domain-containing protein n=1 Tax=Gallaecimonas pentaromativorans TaxID=584787 RepID=A0A3N1PVG7_9GAMM|nr:PilZ domain-containing protein [Gallaecimonas pentaromativorans]MED5524533.1 PilZ domain-containing protein [Pseudomonadota bacterium]ROQ28546.1 PilZ domain-containing protein [Gallaecimonas pentaromativorans]